MDSSILLFLLILISVSYLASPQYLDLSIGAKCQHDWVCTTVEKCSVLGNLKFSKPRICSFNGSTPILCCPPENNLSASEHRRQSNERVIKECKIFYHIPCDEKLPSNQIFNVTVGGSPAKPREHRHMALIGYGDDISSAEWQCGGSIISNHFILSAAHCVQNPLKQLANWVRVGDLDTSTDNDDANPQTFRIIQRIVHPDYKTPEMYNDIALFRLEESIVYDEWIWPVCLYTEPTIPNTFATVTGWGRTDFVGETSSHLMAVDVPLVPTYVCKSLISSSRKIPRGIDSESMICAGEKEGGKDACSGDSGGPLVINTTSCEKTQIGIISFGRMCALPDSPGVYTRVYHFIPWIQTIVWPITYF